MKRNFYIIFLRIIPVYQNRYFFLVYVICRIKPQVLTLKNVYFRSRWVLPLCLNLVGTSSANFMRCVKTNMLNLSLYTLPICLSSFYFSDSPSFFYQHGETTHQKG